MRDIKVGGTTFDADQTALSFVAGSGITLAGAFDDQTDTVSVTITGGGGSSPSTEEILRTALGLISENQDLMSSSFNSGLSGGQITCGLMGFKAGAVVTNILLSTAIAAAGTDPTLMKVALADTTGKILAVSADLKSSAIWKSTGYSEAPLGSPYTVPSNGAYYVCALQVGTWGATQPTFTTGGVQGHAAKAKGSSAARFLWQNGQTDFPAVNSSMTLIAGGSNMPWFGAS